MSKNLCTLYLVRHGKTDWNEKKLIQGHTDIPLIKEGKDQAEALARELKDIIFDKIFSSDLLRAKQTAEIIADKHNLLVEVSSALRERNYAHLEGEPHARLAEIDDALSMLSKDKQFSYKHHPDIESMEETMDRFLRFLRKVAAENLGKNILVVSHGGPMWMFLSLLNYLDMENKFIKISNLAFIKIESDGKDFFVKQTQGISFE